MPRVIFLRLLILSLLILKTSFLFSTDSIRIVSFPRHFQFSTKLASAYSSIEVSNPDLSNELNFRPNSQTIMGLGFSYSWLSVGFSFALSPEAGSELKKGKTKQFDFEAHYNLRRVIVDLTLKSYQGFYFSNPKDFIPDWKSTDPYPQVPGLATFSIATSFAYILRPDRYSPNAAYTYTKAMRRSGGSWMLGGYLSLNGIGSYTDSSIVPSSIRQYVDPKLNIKNAVYSNIGVSFGYSHLFTIRKKNFISLTILPGLSLQNVAQQSSIDLTVKEYKTLSLRTISRFSIGRNGDKYYWGLSTYVESSFIKDSDSQLGLNSGSVEFFFGYRLNTDSWKFMKRVDRVVHPRFLRWITGQPPVRE
ncbi:MAG: DUF4421 family protein [Tenuifilaceae bacterium]